VTAYDSAGGSAPIIAGTDTLGPALLSAPGSVRDLVLGVPSAGPIADDYEDPAWEKFVADFHRVYPDVPTNPSLYAHQYYIATKAALLALEQVDADLGDDQARFQKALAGLTFYTPTGPVRLDHNRQAIVNVFVTVVDVDANGVLYHKIVRVVPNVNQTLGFPETKFLAQGQFGRDNPACP
jgi:branched-chain amino acid transport system substrate-binding protein